MNDQELEKMIVESLRIGKENREYLIKIDRRQRWSQNFTVFYWALIVVFAITGYYFAFPYLQTARDNLRNFSDQVSMFINFK
jgi:hypothetical protein